MQLRLTDKFNETDDVITFVWEPAEPLSWQAGQFLKYLLPHDDADDRGTARWFTIAAPPYEGKPRITTRQAAEKGSSFKRHLFALKPGDTIEVTRPGGDFVVEDNDRPMILLAGGIGITPYRAILEQLDHDNVPLRAALLYANRNDQYIFRDEFSALETKHNDFSIEYFTDPQHIELADLQRAAEKFDNPLYYLSGPEPMVQHYKDLLTGAGIPEDDIKTDYFPGYES